MFAINSSRQEGDRNWTVQQWTLFVYPQRDGILVEPGFHSLESIELGAKTLDARSLSDIGDGGIEQPRSTNQLSLVEVVPVLKKAVYTLLLVIVIVVVFRRFRKKPIQAKSTEPTQLSDRDLRKQFESACRDGDLEHAMGLFYKWLDNFAGSTFKGSIRVTLNEFDQDQLTLAFKNITQTIYSADKLKEIDLKSFARTFISELKRLGRPPGSNSLRVELKLN